MLLVKDAAERRSIGSEEIQRMISLMTLFSLSGTVSPTVQRGKYQEPSASSRRRLIHIHRWYIFGRCNVSVLRQCEIQPEKKRKDAPPSRN